jgi:hypothetical protein
VLNARYAGAANSQATRTAMAAVGDIQPNLALASAAPAAPAVDSAAYLSTFPDVHAAAPVTLASASSTTSATGNSPSVDSSFRSLFQADGTQAQPVSPTVRELWGNSSSLTSVASATPVASASATQTPKVAVPQGLDLFSDRNGTFS